MTSHLSGTCAPTDSQRAWPAARIAEARAVIADVAHHSDHLVRLACNVLSAHGETEAERRDARALLFVIEARCPARHRRAHRADHDDAPEVRR
ncbi:hypothetical protein [Rhodovulum strictum]|uniref:Uncharacterized protein n=1 Tax=Rhodovulum strictum TaxID=58314 RepID=A0A844BLL8_9RHOB|nr:hypothetical protein [Rhodovulum strictum]MRH21902.1 hypothetical protein [Rhodovulum strictum]